MIPRPADTAFHHIADTQLLSDFFEVPRDAALVLHDRSATDHFQVLDLGKIRQQFVLNAVGKVSVLFFLAQIFQRQHRNAFFRHSRRNSGDCPDLSVGWVKYPEIPSAEGEQTKRCKPEGENSLFLWLKERPHR